MGNGKYEVLERTVSVNSFYISPYEVTIKDWSEFVEATSLDFEWNNEYWGDIWDYSESELSPVQYVQWWQAILYCNWLSEKDSLEPVYTIFTQNNVEWDNSANGYRLPTEAEWEYAARGGNKSIGYIYSGSNNPFEVGWFKENADDICRDVGTMKPNELGLYDMSGNMAEWCWGTRYWDFNESMLRSNPSFIEQHIIKGGHSRAFVERVPTYYRTSFVYNGKGLVGLRIVRNAE